MKVKRSKKFLKHYQKLPMSIQRKVDGTLATFFVNPFLETLRNHPLKGKYLGCKSIDVTGDYRIRFRELSDRSYELIELLDVGTHSQLY